MQFNYRSQCVEASTHREIFKGMLSNPSKPRLRWDEGTPASCLEVGGQKSHDRLKREKSLEISEERIFVT